MQGLDGLLYALGGLQGPPVDGRRNQLAWDLLVLRDLAIHSMEVKAAQARLVDVLKFLLGKS